MNVLSPSPAIRLKTKWPSLCCIIDSRMKNTASKERAYFFLGPICPKASKRGSEWDDASFDTVLEAGLRLYPL